MPRHIIWFHCVTHRRTIQHGIFKHNISVYFQLTIWGISQHNTALWSSSLFDPMNHPMITVSPYYLTRIVVSSPSIYVLPYLIWTYSLIPAYSAHVEKIVKHFESHPTLLRNFPDRRFWYTEAGKASAFAKKAYVDVALRRRVLLTSLM
jgi:hypothetical protein